MLLRSRRWVLDRHWLRLGRRRVRGLVAFRLFVAIVIDQLAFSTWRRPIPIARRPLDSIVAHLNTCSEIAATSASWSAKIGGLTVRGRIYEYRPTFIHSKFLVVDGAWSVIGSPNLNSRSRQLDEENAFAILDPALGGQLEATFLADAAQSDEIQLQTWRKRNPALRLVQLLARVLDQQS